MIPFSSTYILLPVEPASEDDSEVDFHKGEIKVKLVIQLMHRGLLVSLGLPRVRRTSQMKNVPYRQAIGQPL